MENEKIHVVLGSTLGTDEWDVDPPVDVPVQALIRKFLRTPEFGLPERDDNGNLIPYRLLWKEKQRYLGESETLRSAGVQEGNVLIMAYEARAGLTRRAAGGPGDER